MKKLYLAIVALMIGFSASASIDGIKSVVLNYTDGTSTAIAIENDMTTSLANGELKLSCSKGDITASTDDLKHWTYSTLPGDSQLWMGINLPTTDTIAIQVQQGCVYMSNLPAGCYVALTAIDGRTVYAQKTPGGQLTINTSSLQKGIYVLTYNNKSIKIALNR